MNAATKQSICGKVSSVLFVHGTSETANHTEKRAARDMHIPNGSRQTYHDNPNLQDHMLLPKVYWQMA
jgi:hypothetical protein